MQPSLCLHRPRHECIIPATCLIHKDVDAVTIVKAVPGGPDRRPAGRGGEHEARGGDENARAGGSWLGNVSVNSSPISIGDGLMAGKVAGARDARMATAGRLLCARDAWRGGSGPMRRWWRRAAETVIQDAGKNKDG